MKPSYESVAVECRGQIAIAARTFYENIQFGSPDALYWDNICAQCLLYGGLTFQQYVYSGLDWHEE